MYLYIQKLRTKQLVPLDMLINGQRKLAFHGVNAFNDYLLWLGQTNVQQILIQQHICLIFLAWSWSWSWTGTFCLWRIGDELIQLPADGAAAEFISV